MRRVSWPGRRLPDLAAEPEGDRPATDPHVLRSDPVFRVAFLLGALWLVLYTALTVASQHRPELAKLTANVLYLVPIAAAAVAGGLAARRRRDGSRTGRSWIVFTLSTVCWLVGEVIWAYYAYSRPGDEPGASLADVFYVLGGLLVPVGFVVVFGRAHRRREQARRALLDVVLVSLGVATLGWQTLVVPQLDDLPDGFSGLITVAYPLTDIAILICLASLGVSGHDRLPLSLRLVGWAYVNSVGADVVYAYQTINGSYGDASWTNVVYQVAAIVLVFAGLAAARLPEQDPRPVVAGRDFTIVPLLVAAVAAWAVVALQIVDAGIPVLPVVVAAVIVAGLLYRQLTVSNDRTRLARELRDALAEQARLAVTDPLTGLHNRRYLQEALAREVARCSRSGAALSLVVLDLDHFKRINDTYGHDAGDAVLVQTAARLRTVARAGDVVARQGGEEFAWLLPDTAAGGAAEMAERLRAALVASPVELPEAGPIVVSGSLGVATLGVGSTGVTLGRDADRALYRAKEGGRNRIAVAEAARPAAGQSVGGRPAAG